MVCEWRGQGIGGGHPWKGCDCSGMEVSPAQTPSCKPAGGKREVKTRMEEPGGGWRREDFSNLFDLPIKLVCSQSLAGVIILKTLLFTCGLILEEVD